MAYSYQTYVVTQGGNNPLPVTIDILDRSEVQVLLNGVPVPYSNTSISAQRWRWQVAPGGIELQNPAVVLLPPAALGSVVTILRRTELDKMRNDFSDGAQFIAENLDTNYSQLLHLAQEAREISDGTDGSALNTSFEPSATIHSTNVQSAIEEVNAHIPVPAIDFPRPNGAVAEIGSSPRYALEDHVHAGGSGGGGGGGGDGAPGASNGIAYAYKRADFQPVDLPGQVVYTFSVGGITLPVGNDLANGWTKAPPPTTPGVAAMPLWVTVASASSTSSADTINANEWATPVILAQDGADGLSGLNTATIFLYQRNTTGITPTGPGATVTYLFSPPTVSGLTNGWVTEVPDASGGQYLYVTTATALSRDPTDTVGVSEWAPVQRMAQNGNSGAAGLPGLPGVRGTVTIAQGGYSSWSDSAATAVVAAAGYGIPRDRDIVTLYGPGFSSSRFYSSGAWVTLTAYINGNMLVSGTLAANTIAAGSLLANVRVQFGTGHTTNGKAFEILTSGVVETDNMFAGFVTADNFYNIYSSGLRGVSSNNSAQPGVDGNVAGSNANTSAFGTRGRHSYYGTEGRVGTGIGYDFYASGSGTNYGPFTGAHDALVLKTEAPVIGDIMVDVACLARGTGISNTIFSTTRSSTPNQKTAIGVLCIPTRNLSIDEPPAAFVTGYGAEFEPVIAESYPGYISTHNRAAVNALGEGMINVVGEGGAITAGDYICTSSTAGKGMKQTGDALLNSTVARARESVTFVGYEVKQVACVYLCG